MATIENPANSIWPNGLKLDSEGYVAFYSLGTNKVDIDNVTWPIGTKIVSPFVYDAEKKISGFFDTKSLTSSTKNDKIVINYPEFEGEFTFPFIIEKGENCRELKLDFKLSPEDTVSHTEISDDTKTWLRSAVKIEDNVLYDGNDAILGAYPTGCISVGGIESNVRDGLFNEDSSLISFDSDLSLLTNGQNMFCYNTSLASFNSNLKSLEDGGHMFCSDYSLVSFNGGDLSNLTDGDWMFRNCSSLTSFEGNLSSLTNSYGMFENCSSLTSFEGDLSNLTDGENMFYWTTLASFHNNLSNLTNGRGMFCGCMFDSFSSDLSSLINGRVMFYGCVNLTSFTSNLSSLTNGYDMFTNCKLDTASVKHIANTIKNVTGLTNGSSIFDNIYKQINIGIASKTPLVNEEENAAFWKMHNEKGWNVYVNGSQYNPTEPTAIATLDENGEEVSTPIPFWAKPVETDEEHAEYVGEDGKFYNVVGGQFIYVSDPETYGMFTSLADAVTNMRLTKIEK